MIVVVCVAELKKSQHSTEAMKKQSEGLHKEYDRLSEEYSRLQVSSRSVLHVLGLVFV